MVEEKSSNMERSRDEVLGELGKYLPWKEVRQSKVGPISHSGFLSLFVDSLISTSDRSFHRIFSRVHRWRAEYDMIKYASLVLNV